MFPSSSVGHLWAGGCCLRGPNVSNKCQRLKRIEIKMLYPQRQIGNETGGHSDSAEKRNSVNPLLIRYNGSLVVYPVRTHLAYHKFACVDNGHR